MNEIFRETISNICSLYRRPVARGALAFISQGGAYHISYKCNHCKTEFRVDHKWRGWSCGGYNTGRISCPICGSTFYASDEVMCTAEDDSEIPSKVELSILENDTKLKLQASYKSYRFDEYGTCFPSSSREVITFNVKSRITTFACYKKGKKVFSANLGNPKSSEFLEKSLLKYLRYYRGCTKDYLHKIAMALKLLRSNIRKKYLALHGLNLGSMVIANPMPRYGRMSGHIQYMAFRMLLPDLKRLPDTGGYEKVFQDINALVKAPDSVTAILNAYDIPNKKSFRRIVLDNPEHAKTLSVILKHIHNYDIARTLYVHFKESFTPQDFKSPESIDKLLGFWKQYRSEQEIKNFLIGSDWWLVSDTYRMEKQLNEKNAAVFKRMKLDGKAHDWLKDRIYEQEHEDYELKVPVAIRKRFEMQKDTLKMLMPDTYYKLIAAGKELHNCVGTYGSKVLEQQCNIVLVADDKGLLVACLEIKNGEVIQAKLKYNEPLCENREIQQQVVNWACEVGLRIATADIVTSNPNELQTKSA